MKQASRTASLFAGFVFATAVIALLAAPPAEARGSGGHGRSHGSFHVSTRTSTAHHSLNYTLRAMFGGGK